MTEASLIIKVDSSQAAAASKTLDELAKSGGVAEKQTNSLTDSAKSLAAAVGIGLSVNYFKNLIVGAVDAADRLNDLKKSTGISVETLSGLELAAKQSGGSLDGIAASLNKLSMGIGKDSEKFRELGITAKEPLEAFKQLSDQFVKIKDPQERAAFAAQALGKSWQEAAPLLSEGGAAIQAMVDKGISLSGMTTSFAESADELNDTWALMETTASGLVSKALVPMLPAMQNAAGAISDFVSSDQLESWINKAITAAELLALALGTKLVYSASQAVISTLSLAAASGTATGATVGLTAAQNAGLIVQNLLTASTQKLSVAMGILFSPAGIIALSAAGLYLLVENQKKVADTAWKEATAFDEVAASLQSLTKEELARHIYTLQNVIDKTNTDIATKKKLLETLNPLSDAHKSVSEQIRVLDLKVTSNTANQSLLTFQLNRVKEGHVGVKEATIETTSAIVDYTEKTSEQIAETERQLKMLTMTEREAAIYSATWDDYAQGVAPETIKKLEEVTGKLFDQELAIKNAATAEKKRVDDIALNVKALNEVYSASGKFAADEYTKQQKAFKDSAEKAAKAAEDAQEKSAKAFFVLRDNLSSSFADILLNGESLSEKLGDMFKRLAAKIISDWIASGVLQMISGNGSFSMAGSLQGAGTSGQIISAIGNQIAGKVVSTVAGSVGGSTAASGGASIMGSILGSTGIAAASTAAATTAGATLLPGAGVLAIGQGGLATTGAAAASSGGIGAGIASIGSSIAATASAAGSAIMSGLAAIPGWGWAALAAAGAIKLLDKESTPSWNAGLLLEDVAGASADQKFDVAPFASGLAPVGFKRDASVADATAIIDVFRQDDALMTKLATELGIPIDLSSGGGLKGYSETGSGVGVFLGAAGEHGGSGAAPSLDTQRQQYISGFINTIKGSISTDAYNQILNAGSADAMLEKAIELQKISMDAADGNHAMGLDFVPFDGYRATLHRGERVMSAESVRVNDLATDELKGLRSDFNQMMIALNSILASSNQTARALGRAVALGEGSLAVTVL